MKAGVYAMPAVQSKLSVATDPLYSAAYATSRRRSNVLLLPTTHQCPRSFRPCVHLSALWQLVGRADGGFALTLVVSSS